MTTTTKKQTPRTTGKHATIRPSRTKKPLRIKPDLLPDSARYITVDDIEYIALPVADFGEWREDIETCAILDYARDNPAPRIPLADVVAKNRAARGKTRS